MQGLARSIILSWGWKRIVIAVLAGAFGVLALPPFGIFAAMFLSFTLLVWLIDGAAAPPESGFLGRLWPAFATGWLFGFGYFVAGLWWLGHALLIDSDAFAWALPFAILGLPAFLAVFYGLAAAAARLFWSDGVGRIAALSASFGLAEWVRGTVLTGFPWNAIGYAMTPVPLMMQSAHLIGITGITTLAVFVFAAPALLGTRQGAGLGLAAAGLLLAGHLSYGALVLKAAPRAAETKGPVVRLVQPSIAQTVKMDTDADRAAIFEQHLALTAAAPAAGGKRPDIVVWPETALPFILTDHPEALSRIAATLEDDQILLTGAVRAEEAGGNRIPRYYNSIYEIDGRGQILAAADKIHLVPFGEYVPFENLLSSLGIGNVVEMPGGFSAGAKRGLLALPAGPMLYPLICYEIIFPEEMEDVGRGVGAILNVTNDAWFGNTPGPYQHFLQARLRAVELGLPLIRAANNGISAVVDAQGRIVKGLALNETGFIEVEVKFPATSENDFLPRQLAFWFIETLLSIFSIISRLKNRL